MNYDDQSLPPRHSAGHHHTTPPVGDATDEFWGADGGWEPAARQPDAAADTPRRRRTGHSRDITRPIAAIREGLAAFKPQVRNAPPAGIDRTREHGIVRPPIDPLMARQPASATPRHDPVETRSAPPARRRPAPQPERDPLLPTRHAPAHREATIAELAAGSGTRTPHDDPGFRVVDETRHMAAFTDEPRRQSPLLARILALGVVTAVAVPLAMSMRDDSTATLNVAAVTAPAPAASTIPVVTYVPPVASRPAANPVTAQTVVAVDNKSTSTQTAERAPAPAADTQPRVPVVSPQQATETTVGAAIPATNNETSATTVAPAAVTTTTAPATTTTTAAAPSCDNKYAAQAGDSWYLIAKRAGVSVSALTAQNSATIDTVILVGGTICLPSGATTPTAPATTVAPSTTAAPSPTPTTAPQATTTTTPATTTTDAPVSSSVNATPAEVKAMIREIWPDHLEDKALLVAYRESNYRPTAYNGHCCYGIFQLYYSVHKSWMRDYGIYSADDLYDPRKNITAAYALYQRAGSWRPWSQTAY